VKTATAQAKDDRLVERIAEAVLYEGYILYPYRPSAVKNQQRWNFGVIFPEPYAVAQKGTESSTMRTECLVEVDPTATLDIKVRFLHLLKREVGKLIDDCQSPHCAHVLDESSKHFLLVPSLELNGQMVQAWQEAVEREVVVPQMKADSESPRTMRFHFPSSRTIEHPIDVGLIVRNQQSIAGEIEISASSLSSDKNATDKRRLIKLAIVIRNLTSFDNPGERSRDDALLQSFVSTHTILEVLNGAFVSLLDPPDVNKAAAATCANIGTYPVLVGNEGDRDCMLSSPIILYDYPQIAPQSAGNLFDGTEIDEILTLRIMSLTDEEKREMRSADDLARRLLERTEALSPADLMNLHGVMKKG
jgi:hypothetical protein